MVDIADLIDIRPRAPSPPPSIIAATAVTATDRSTMKPLRFFYRRPFRRRPNQICSNRR